MANVLVRSNYQIVSGQEAKELGFNVTDVKTFVILTKDMKLAWTKGRSWENTGLLPVMTFNFVEDAENELTQNICNEETT